MTPFMTCSCAPPHMWQRPKPGALSIVPSGTPGAEPCLPSCVTMPNEEVSYGTRNFTLDAWYTFAHHSADGILPVASAFFESQRRAGPRARCRWRDDGPRRSARTLREYELRTRRASGHRAGPAVDTQISAGCLQSPGHMPMGSLANLRGIAGAGLRSVRRRAFSPARPCTRHV